MADEADGEPGIYQESAAREPGAVHKFFLWVKYFFKRRGPAIWTILIVCGLLVWFSGTIIVWVGAPALGLLCMYIMKTVASNRLQHGITVIVETRLQGHIIKHCDHAYYRDEKGNSQWVKSEVSRTRILGVPNQRMADVFAYGDQTPIVKAQSILFADRVDITPNGEIIVIFPESVNVSNAGLVTRAIPELAEALAQIGELRQDNVTMQDLAYEAYAKGKISKDQYRRSLLDFEAIETKLAMTPGAQRDLFAWYRSNYVAMVNERIMMVQHMQKRVKGEAAKLFYTAIGQPIMKAQEEKIIEFTTAEEIPDLERTARELRKRGKRIEQAAEAAGEWGARDDQNAKPVLKGTAPVVR